MAEENDWEEGGRMPLQSSLFLITQCSVIIYLDQLEKVRSNAALSFLIGTSFQYPEWNGKFY